jgi:O-methyltransferase
MFQNLMNIESRRKIRKLINRNKHNKLYSKYRAYTMIPKKCYLDNLEICEPLKFRNGCLVECGVWRGGMIASITEVMGINRNVYLFDSFEGLPQATIDDGETAIAHQKNTTGPDYFDNCKAEIEFSQKAMKISGAKNPHFIKGYFENTLPEFSFPEEIIILRLDGDWYDSTMQCLDNLYDKVASGGLIIIDDYYYWDGCTRAIHDFLSKRKLPVRIHETTNGVCYFYKY